MKFLHCFFLSLVLCFFISTGHADEIAVVQLSFDGINTFHCGVGTIVQQTHTILQEWNKKNGDHSFKLYLLSGDYSPALEEYSEETLQKNREECRASGGDLFLIPTMIRDEMFGNPQQWEELCMNGAKMCSEIINQNSHTLILAHDTAYAQLPLRLEELKKQGKIHGSCQVLWIPHATSWSYNGHTDDGIPRWPERHAWELAASRGASPTTYQIGCISDTMKAVLLEAPFNVSEKALFPFLTGIILDRYLDEPPSSKVIEELSKHNIPLDKRLIFSIGRANPLKGLDITLEMFRHLRRKNPDLHLVLLAPISDYMPSYQQLLKNRIEKENLDVTLIETFDPDIAHYIYQYENTELVCLLSRMDTKPLTVMESRVNPKNCVILVSNSDRMGDQVIDGINGFTCSLDGIEEIIEEPISLPHPIQNVIDKAQCILDLSDKKRRAVIHAAKELISTTFDLRANMETNLENLFSKMAREPIETRYPSLLLDTIKREYGWRDSLQFTAIKKGLANPPLAIFKEPTSLPSAILKWIEGDPFTAEDRFVTLNHFRENGCPFLPRILENREGKYVSSVGSSNFILMDYLSDSGDEITFNDMLRLTGRLHQHTEGVEPSERLRISKLDEYKARHSVFLDPWFVQHYSDHFDTPSWRVLTERSSYFCTPHFHSIYRSLPKTLIHGDNNQSNILISNNAPYFIDLDSFRYDVRLLDLASYFRYGGYQTYESLCKNRNLLSIIRTTYASSASPLTPLEEGNLALIVEFSQFDFLSWALEELKYSNQNNMEVKEEVLLNHITTYQNQLSKDLNEKNFVVSHIL